MEAHEQLIDIAREAVRNAYRHADPTRVAVTVEYGKRALRMIVADDGRGSIRRRWGRDATPWWFRRGWRTGTT